MASHARTKVYRLAALAVGAGLVAGCSADSGPSVEKANDELRSTSFHASGGTTAFAGGAQEIWWDPEQGLRLKSSGNGGSGEMYCKDGTTYFSAALFAASLKQRGQSITVPSHLTDIFITAESDQDCDVYFAIPESAEHAPWSDGKRTTAFAVSEGGASDTYYVDNESSRLVQLEAERDGRTSTTNYDSFGEKFSITIPTEDQTMSSDEFRSQVSGS
ncbi:hypothetical protein [Streptomyces sp. MUM 178J]|uniref:hypothetical protein n=1 Tax=Streptomyces sp. MUM 178J TaxID=2791991 RepID=UPI001F0406A9|nr:hypothetical protein [Streptomyces sp. MUM 178J]WRQ82743.1 hypothetical protein I3F59_027220 [Streptomyces sp. MUM 178J]